MRSVVKMAVLAILSCGLIGCSDDGGFFPGMMTHNEGAVDYRVVPLDMKGDVLSCKEACRCRAEGVPAHFVSLGCPTRAPYVPLDRDTMMIRTFKPDLPSKNLEEAEVKQSTARHLVDALKTEIDSLTTSIKTLDTDIKEFPNTLAKLDDERVNSREQYRKKGIEVFRELPTLPENAATDAIAARNDLYTKFLECRDPVETARKICEQARVALPDKSKPERLDSAINAFMKATDGLVAAETKILTTQSSNAARVNERAELQIKLTDAKANQTQANTQLAAASAAHLNATKTDSGDVPSVRVTLKQAYIRGFRERDPVGEMAVLVTVKESSAGLGTQEPRAGRVIYYSEGVRQNAFMNFRDLPVYGPIRYGQEDLQIRVSVVEFDDKDNEVVGAMLKTLAALGSIVYPPSSPVLATLDRIGESILNLNGPDLEWDYPLSLSAHPPKSTEGTPVGSWLRDGYYVLFRSDVSNRSAVRQRVSREIWAKLYLDPSTGTVYGPSDTPKGEWQEYTGHSYLVLAVQTGLESTKLDLAQDTSALSSLVGAYSDGSDSLLGATKAVTDAIQYSLERLKARRERKDDQSKEEVNGNSSQSGGKPTESNSTPPPSSAQ